MSHHLPISNYELDVVATIRENPVTILVGETGSGKTTQVPLFLLTAGFGRQGRIGVTQPRRLAAISVAQYVAGQRGEAVGGEVGYQIRFDDTTQAGTRIKFMSDGILLQEAKSDPLFSQYEVLIIDEAHERSLNTDFVLGLVARALTLRSDLKVVVMSATIDAEKFSTFFGGAPILRVEGKMFPVGVSYLTPEDIEIARQRFPIDPLSRRRFGVEELAAYQVEQIHLYEGPGDILVFMPGKGEIFRTMQLLNERQLPDLQILAVHGDMSPEDQLKIFERHHQRRVILATNVAETSLTIDGVVYVVDSGVIRQTDFNFRTGIGSLDVVEHSKAGLEQRRGRAGRTQPGHCYRLFLEEQNGTNRPEFTRPEILRSDLAGVVLRMIGIGITDVGHFKFVDQPDESAFEHAYEKLHVLGALDQDDRLTTIGLRLLELPVEPSIGRMILAAIDHGCVAEICTIAAGLSAREPFIWPKNEEEQAYAHQAKIHLADPRSDFLTLLSVVTAYHHSGQDWQWARSHYVNARSLDEILKIRQQLIELLEWQGVAITSCGYSQPGREPTDEQQAQAEAIGKAVLAGLLQHLIRLSYRHGYKRLLASERSWTDELVYIHPGSAVFGADPAFLVCGSMVETQGKDRFGLTRTKTYARTCMGVTVDWVREVAPHLVTTKVTESSYLGSRYLSTYINGHEVDCERLEEEKATDWWSRRIPVTETATYKKVSDLRRRADTLLFDLTRYCWGEIYREELTALVDQLTSWQNELYGGAEEEAFSQRIPQIEARITELEWQRNEARIRWEEEQRQKEAEQRQELRAQIRTSRDRLEVLRQHGSWCTAVGKEATAPLNSIQAQLEKVEGYLQEDWLQSAQQSFEAACEQLAQLEANYTIWEAEQLLAAQKRAGDEQYLARVEELTRARWPGFDQYRFALDTRGEPMSYRDSDGYLCEYDLDASDELPEKGKSYWGFVNQTLTRNGVKVRRIGLLMEVPSLCGTK